MKYIVTQPFTLLEILQQIAPTSSKNTLRSWIQTGRVTVNKQQVTRANQIIHKDQEVCIGPRVVFLRPSIRILYEDDDLVVLEKPEGLLSVATDFETRMTLHAFLKRRFHQRRVYPVHRLDRETSGVMMFAYHAQACDALKKQFEQHHVEKTYFAIVEGEMKQKKGTWKSFLEEDDFYTVKSTSPQRGKLAVTHYEVIKTENNYSLLVLRPQTGRKNQLRVHCSENGYPIVGDKKYGATTNPVKRLGLHAQKLVFTHPSRRRRMTFSTPLPESFSQIITYPQGLSKI